MAGFEGLQAMAMDSGEHTFFGKILALIDSEATGARPRQAPDLVRDLVSVLAKLIEAAPKDHRNGLRAIIYEELIVHLERIGKGQPLELPNEHEGPLQ
jgi:hypothetical protein